MAYDCDRVAHHGHGGAAAAGILGQDFRPTYASVTPGVANKRNQ